MQAILIATGEENKLSPLTADMPSPMIPVVDRPVIVYAIELLARAGFRDIFVSLYEQANQIESYLGNGERWNVNLHYLLQREASGSAGALKRAAALLTETFIVLPADAIVDLDIQAALDSHYAHGSLATAILAQAPLQQQAAQETQEHGLAVAATAPNGAINLPTGGFIFEPAVLDYVPAKTVFDCQTELLATLQGAGHAAHSYLMAGYWNPLATFSDFQAAQNTVLASLGPRQATKSIAQTAQGSTLRFPYVDAGELQPGVWVGPNTLIHHSVRLTPPLFIGAGCRIGRDVELGPDTVIGAGVVIDDGVTVQQSTVLPYTYVGQFLHLAERVAHQSELIDVNTGVNIQITDPWLLSAIDPALSSSLLRSLVERVLALGALIVSAPFMLCISLAIWLTSGGPVTTRVQRVGRMPMTKGRTNLAQLQLIGLEHFRTRDLNNKPTRLGKELELWELYRLPELWNVVRGEIGLVGVKPLPIENTVDLLEAWQQRRFDAPVGFTGLWYTQAQPTIDLDELCVIDAYQATTHTWREDFLQLWLTPMAWYRHRRAPQTQLASVWLSKEKVSPGQAVHFAYAETEKKQIVKTTFSEQTTQLVFSRSDRLY